MKEGVRLTKGPIGRSLFLFALPLFGSSLIQQLYNTVDLIFVGRILGTDASAAVGSGGLVVTSILGLFTGLGVGVGIAAGHAFGADDGEELDQVVHTAAGISIAGGILFTILGWILTPVFLRWLNTPENILGLSVVYLRIYFLSLLFIIAYNISSGILRSLGDSRMPMLYQLAGGIANVFGNAFFMYVLKLGVAGAALSTVLWQGVAAALRVRHLRRMQGPYRLRFSRIRIHPHTCGKILRVGIPSAVQSVVITLSNLIVQSRINGLGVDSIAAFTIYFKVENLVYLPILAVGQANAAFASQNMGAGFVERIKKGTWTSAAMGVFMTVLISTAVLLFPGFVLGWFSTEAAVIRLGTQIVQITFPFYFLYVFLEVFAGTLRGAGRAAAPMLVVILNLCVVRILVLEAVMRVWRNVQGVALIYPVTWAVTALCLFACYKEIRWEEPGKAAGISNWN